MAITDKFVSSFSELWYVGDDTTFATLTALGGTDEFMGTVSAGNVGTKIPLVGELGNISNEATIIDTPTFGETYKGKIRGQLDAGQLDATLYWAPQMDSTAGDSLSNVHDDLKTKAENGTHVTFGIKWADDAAGTNKQYVAFRAYISSFGIESSFDDVVKASMTIAIDGALNWDDDA
jgi:hypothetical protein